MMRWLWHVKFLKRKRAASGGNTAGEPIGLLLALTKAS